MRSGSQNKLGEMPIGRLLVSMSVPMMISMFIQALYNLVDSMFVAKISEDALTAVSLAFPLQSVMSAIAVGTGVGVNALVSRSLGEGNRERADRAANVQVLLSLGYTAVFVLLGLSFSRGFYTTQTDVASIIDYGQDYVRIVCCFSLGLFFSQNFEKLLVATGNSTPSMISQATGAVLNILLDPVFIFGLGPVPAMGVRGAAVATVIGQFAAAFTALAFNLKCNSATRFRLSQMRPDKKTLKAIYAVGLPSMLTIGLSSIMSYLINGILLGFSTTATAVFGVWLKLQSFGFMPVFGMNNGTIAIFSYNHGAGKIDRVNKTLRLALTTGGIITLAAALLYEAIPGLLLSLFSASDNMRTIGIPAIRICAASLPFGALSIICASACQSLGHAGYSLAINLSRQLVLQVTAAYLLSLFGRLTLIWIAPLLAEVLTLVFAAALAGKVMRELNAPA
ncbi:MAG: MATE family efflux transporter [Oscillospiraceae bacterium]